MPLNCKKFGFIAALAIIFLTACSDDATTEQITNNYITGLDFVETAMDLPKCTSDNEGVQILVKGENTVHYCLNGEWKVLNGDADTVYVSRMDTVVVSSTDTVLVSTPVDYSCETKALSDESGVVIYCNGDSIGIVYNGIDAKSGATGDGCLVTEYTDSTVTMLCGNGSYVMRLKERSVIDSSSSTVNEIENANITGYVQKGPFVNGSKVTLYELLGNRALSQTGNVYGGNITTNDGKFTVNNVSLVAGYARLEATGFYRNEVTGKNSNANITLNAYTDLGDRNKFNVNVLTHLEYYRANYLMANSDGTLKIKTAKKQAEGEIFRSVFDIDSENFGYSEDLDIFGSDEGNAALLALSIMLQGDRGEADLTALLTAFGQDIQADGVWNGTTANNSAKTWRDSIADWVFEKDLAGSFAIYRNNITSWGLGDVPDFEKYLRKYYGTELGLGVCGEDAEVGSVLNVTNANSSHYASSYTSTDDAGGTVRYICDGANKVWREATTIEKDTAKWSENGPYDDASVKKGNVTDTMYVYDELLGSWRYASELDSVGGLNGGCTKKRSNQAGLRANDTTRSSLDNQVYYCSLKGGVYTWQLVGTLKNDTYGENCPSVDGELFSGKVTSDNKYVCENGEFRTAFAREVILNRGCVSSLQGTKVANDTSDFICEQSNWNIWKDTLKTGRTGEKNYLIVRIGSQVWMAENLNYAPNTKDDLYKDRFWCYNNSEDSCAKYGRLYTWATAMDSAGVFSEDGKGCGYGKTCTVTQPARGICPENWHIPNNSEWNTLFTLIGGDTKAGVELKSGSGWFSDGNGIDYYGFSVLPAGNYYDGSFSYAGYSGNFWSSSESDDDCAYSKYFRYYYSYVRGDNSDKISGNSVRCIRN